ncbi:hypothetical protein HISP_09385 [Haloarcula hispanica N601]|uniref:Uncharacterized protein n=2 Tax=Haloarcula hispanica TaxID=51589 RepID=V5TNR9_HALHI|nr:hypothetical protein [Haloarcula hispanica]AEM57439.1 conserved hypothetical protein [Haloarcula hispanica ATCC 33960]AHB66204.1 hypothetical protein HISP_09385 [Haloarcula hispanica N601]
MVANERGQLLLVGGIAVAIVVFSTILFAHSLAVTDGITTTGSADTIERTADREASVERDLGQLAAQARGDGLDGFEERYEYALRNYTRTHNRVVASSGGTYLNATLNESASKGTEVNRTGSSSEFKRPNPSGGGNRNDWTVANSVSHIAVFNLTADVVGGSTNTFTVVIRNGPEDMKLSVEPSTSDSGNNVTVDGKTQCHGNGDVTVDLAAGSCTVGSNSSSFDSYHSLNPPYSVEIKNGNKAEGRYQFAAVGTFPSSNYAAPVARVNYPVVPAIDMTYDTPSASYNRTVLVEVDD